MIFTSALYIALGAVFTILLIKSTQFIISSSTKLARHFKVSEYTISFLAIAFATSLPELLVGIAAAVDKKPVLSYGNVLGSNIADLTIIIAIPILVGGAISTREAVKNKDLVYAAFFGLLPIVLVMDKTLTRVDSMILLLSYIFYIILVVRRSSPIEQILERLNQTNVYKQITIFGFSSLVLLLSAEVIVKIAEKFSIVSGVPLIFIGLTLTAVGTSLPELAFGLEAVKTEHKNEVIGNVIGSVIANSTFVLGITGLIAPIAKSDNHVGITSRVFLLLILLIFFLFSLSDKKLGRTEAVILIFVYIAFVSIASLVTGF